jgi:hypothetical protein
MTASAFAVTWAFIQSSQDLRMASPAPIEN